MPFISVGFVDTSLNTIIYGHKMDDDTMFSTLLSYAKAEYYSQHPTITYNTISQNAEYEIFAAFYSEDYSVSGNEGFMYYNYYNVQDKSQYDEFVANCKASALYDTGITPVYGDELVTLSTCSYHKENGRFVVVAKIK